METPWYKTRDGVTSGCRCSGFFSCRLWLCRVQRGHYSILLPTDSFRCRKDELGMLPQFCRPASLGLHHTWCAGVLCSGFSWTDLFSVRVHVRGICCTVGVWWVIQEEISAPTVSYLWGPNPKVEATCSNGMHGHWALNSHKQCAWRIPADLLQ